MTIGALCNVDVGDDATVEVGAENGTAARLTATVGDVAFSLLLVPDDARALARQLEAVAGELEQAAE